MKEKWVPAIVWKNDVKLDYSGIYEVSDMGNVRRVPHYVKHNYGGVSLKTAREKAVNISKSGYCFVMLYHNKTIQNCRLNRLVWESFNGKVPDGMQVNHINEDKTDNRLSNLNLMTPAQNSNYGTRTKRLAAKLSKPITQYDLDGNLVSSWPSAKAAEDNLGFSHQNIQKCLCGKTQQAYGYKWYYA